MQQLRVWDNSRAPKPHVSMLLEVNPDLSFVALATLLSEKQKVPLHAFKLLLWPAKSELPTNTSTELIVSHVSFGGPRPPIVMIERIEVRGNSIPIPIIRLCSRALSIQCL